MLVDQDSTSSDAVDKSAIVKQELKSVVGRMLWKEIWGSYVQADRWWWEDTSIIEECEKMGTCWEYAVIQAVKEGLFLIFYSSFVYLILHRHSFLGIEMGIGSGYIKGACIIQCCHFGPSKPFSLVISELRRSMYTIHSGFKWQAGSNGFSGVFCYVRYARYNSRRHFKCKGVKASVS